MSSVSFVPKNTEPVYALIFFSAVLFSEGTMFSSRRKQKKKKKANFSYTNRARKLYSSGRTQTTAY
jgi:hypothetical protein